MIFAATVVLGKSESKSENKNDTFAAKKRQFTYSDIMKITKNFEKVLGNGGFGTVYLGYLDNTEVAVKLLSSSSAQGYKEFHSEVCSSIQERNCWLPEFMSYRILC